MIRHPVSNPLVVLDRMDLSTIRIAYLFSATRTSLVLINRYRLKLHIPFQSAHRYRSATGTTRQTRIFWISFRLTAPTQSPLLLNSPYRLRMCLGSLVRNRDGVWIPKFPSHLTSSVC